MGLDVRAIEKALLTGKWNDELTTSADAPVVKVAHNVVNGDFSDLRTSPSRDLFAVTESSEPNAAALVDRPLAVWFAFADASSGTAEDELLRLTCAPLDVLALGPELSKLVDEDLLHQKAVAELAYGGEPAYHLAKHPIFLLLAKLLLLDTPFQHLQSVPWWRLRAWRIHEQVLDEPVAVPEDVLRSLGPLLDEFASEPDMAGRLLLEQGLLEHYVGHDKSAADYFVRAARATQLEYELTGALGKRTKFQQNDVTQLVLLAESRQRGDGSDASAETSNDAGEGGNNDNDGSTSTMTPATPAPASTPAIPETLPLNDDTLLEQTAFTPRCTRSTNASSSRSAST
ncbi:hypothetical protein ONZ51_g3006 [Trametes cubensis]|uniref:Uncharacterized protein n=1 Tax=Trametes cubensis TaxID=1111947 RepID=A0AAD7TYH6_9APHY|nr:hypothetical protein ONZ51_g3006 [Trametes cubensis]